MVGTEGQGDFNPDDKDDDFNPAISDDEDKKEYFDTNEELNQYVHIVFCQLLTIYYDIVIQ